MINFLVENKEWIFSGIGIFIISILIKFFFGKFFEKKSCIETKGDGSPVIIGNENTVKNEKN